MDHGFLMPALLGALFASVAAAIQLRIAPHKIAEAGHFALGMILALYIGARLASGPFSAVLAESSFAAVMLLGSLASLKYWPRGVGILIIGHGLYDQVFAHDAGMPEWYPPFCLGVDLVLGLAIIVWAKAPPQVRAA